MAEKQYILDDWQKQLEEFRKAAEDAKKDAKAIHKCKQQVQKMKDDIYNHIHSGYFLHDDNRIVISAPEIVIGNVDKDGTLRSPSNVVIRSNGINLEGVGKKGAVTIRANTITNRTEDPGIDGVEAVVYDSAKYSCLSREIAIDSTMADGVFFRNTSSSSTGVSICSDTTISISAALSIDKGASTGLQKTIEQRKKDIEDLISKMTLDSQKTTMEKTIKEIETSLGAKDDLLKSDELSNANVAALDTLIGLVESKASALIGQVRNYIKSISELAEMKRQVAALGDISKTLNNEAYDKDKTTKASLRLNGESVIISTRDGDGKIRENKEAGVSFDQVKAININAKDSQGVLLKDSHVNIETQDVSIITNASKREDKDKPMHYDTAEGSVMVNSKNITVTAYDYDAPEKDTDSPYKMKQLAAEGKITIGANSIDLNTADQEGKAAGTVDINSKSITIQSVNKPKDDGNGGGNNDKTELTDEGTTMIFSKKIRIGGEKVKSETKADKVLVTAKKVVAEGDEETDIMQGNEKKNFIMLKANKLNAKNPDAQVFESSKHDFSGDVNVSKEAKIKTGTIGDLTAKASLKSPNQSDSGGAPLSVSTDKAENIDEE